MIQIRRGWSLLLASLAAGATLACALLAFDAQPALVAVGAFAPLAAAAVATSASFALGLLPATQAFDWIRVDGGLASLSPRTVLIALLFASRLRQLAAILRARADLRIVALALGAWLLFAPLRASHDSFGESPMRGFVTEGAFVGTALVAMTYRGSMRALTAVARGAAVSLLVLAAASLLVNIGWLPKPDRFGPDQEIFGIRLPFVRNYGFDVPYDAVALLLPLCIPYYWFAILGSRAGRTARLEGVLVLTSLGPAFAVLFQARAMIMQLLVALCIAVVLAWRPRWVRRRVIAVASAAAVGIVIAVGAMLDLAGADLLSNRVRTEIDAHVMTTAFREPRMLISGIEEARIVDPVLEDPALGNAVESFATVPIHNFFVADFARGGLVSLALILGVFAYAGVRVVRSGLEEPAARILFASFALVIIEMNLEPVRANVVGAWLVLGLCLGLEGRSASALVGRALAPKARRNDAALGTPRNEDRERQSPSSTDR